MLIFLERSNGRINPELSEMVTSGQSRVGGGSGEGAGRARPL